MDELVEQIREFIKERDWDQYHSPKNLAMALVVETAELAEHFQWLTQEQSGQLPPKKRGEVEDEIGDVLIYLVELAGKFNIDPVEAATRKMEKNRAKYPAEKVRGKALKYTEYE